MEDAPYKYENGKKIDNFEKGHYEGMMTVRDSPGSERSFPI